MSRVSDGELESREGDLMAKEVKKSASQHLKEINENPEKYGRSRTTNKAIDDYIRKNVDKEK